MLRPVDRRSLIEALLPDVYALRTEAEFPEHVIALLVNLIGADKGCFHELDIATGDYRMLASPYPQELDELDDARRAWMHQNPFLEIFRTSPSVECKLLTDFLTNREFRRLGVYGEFFRHLGAEAQLGIPVVSQPAKTVVGMTLERGYPIFTEEERQLAGLLRPHIAAAHANAKRFTTSLRAPLSETARFRNGDDLTDQQRRVLKLVATGSTNAQIALALDIREGTVRKHMEHVFRRLGVTTRTAAAAIYFHIETASSPILWNATVSSFVESQPTHSVQTPAPTTSLVATTT